MRKLQRQRRTRVALFVAFAVLFAFVLSAVYEATQTLSRLDRVERERDQWQRAGEVIQQLDVNEGSTVVDFGSGVGYFTLKLSRKVGKPGKVLAVDVQKFPLYFLRTRALMDGQYNVVTALAEPDDPHLQDNSTNAVLISNTYHELDHPNVILHHLFQSLKPDGRLVVVDRGSSSDDREAEIQKEHHQIAPSQVEADMRKAGFEIVRREDHFTVQPEGGHIWWLIVARKPM